MIRLGILGSTRGSNLLPLIEAIQNNKLAATIELVVSNKEDALILDKARQFAIDYRFNNPKGLSREAFDAQLNELFQQYKVDLIVLIGYMRILSANFVQQWTNKIINTHPSLLPAFSGLMDWDVHRAVLQSGVNKSGCSVHYVTEEVDAGPIIVQKETPVYPFDTAESLRARVQALEGEALIEAVQCHILHSERVLI